MNHGLYTDTAWYVPVLFNAADGTAQDLSGSAYLAEMYLNGSIVFRFRSAGNASNEGTLDVSQAANGIIAFVATSAQHAGVAAGFYRLHLKRDLADDTWQAEGNMLIGAPGAVETYISMDEPGVEAASAASYAALAKYWALQALGAGGGGATVDRELVTTVYQVTTAFAGSAVGDVVTCVQVLDVSGATPSTVAVVWRNQSTATDLGSAPSFSNLALLGSQPLTNAQLRANPVPVLPNVSMGTGNADAATQRVTLAADGPAATALTSINADVGATTASAAPADGSGNYSVIAALKRVLLNGASLLARIPAALGSQSASGSMSVVMSSDLTVTGPAAQSTLNIDLLTGNANGWFDTTIYQDAAIQIIASTGITAGAIIFEQTNDTTAAPNGVPLRASESATLNFNPNIAAITIAASTNRIFRVESTARFIRVRISTAFTGGTVQAIAVFSQRDTSPTVVSVQQATAANLLCTASLAASQTLAAVTSANLGIPTIIADVVSAALTTTTTTAAIVPSFGTCYEVNIPVTVVTGTSPTLDVVVQESDDTGVNWFDVYHFPRITGVGSYRSPKLPFTGNRIRYVQTVGGTTPSFTRAINRLQSSDDTVAVRQIIDRAISITTLNAATAGLNVQNCRNAQLIVNIGTAATPPALQLEASDDGGLSWYALGSPLTAVASSTVQVTINNINAQQIRARVSTAGVTVVAGYVLIKGF
jgi:hypothetical protein